MTTSSWVNKHVPPAWVRFSNRIGKVQSIDEIWAKVLLQFFEIWFVSPFLLGNYCSTNVYMRVCACVCVYIHDIKVRHSCSRGFKIQGKRVHVGSSRERCTRQTKSSSRQSFGRQNNKSELWLDQQSEQGHGRRNLFLQTKLVFYKWDRMKNRHQRRLHHPSPRC